MRSDRGFLEEGVDLAIDTIVKHPVASAIMIVVAATLFFVVK